MVELRRSTLSEILDQESTLRGSITRQQLRNAAAFIRDPNAGSIKRETYGSATDRKIGASGKSSCWWGRRWRRGHNTASRFKHCHTSY